MYTDLFGNIRYKVNLHTHTNRSDGHVSPEDTIRQYRDAGYDAIALTDHWIVSNTGKTDGVTLISGVEYNTPGCNAITGIYHILGLGMKTDPKLDKTAPPQPQAIIDTIHDAGGTAILAHPAWSLNTPEQIMALRGVDATEIYNTVSGVHMSRRADSSLIVDMLATQGRYYPLVADDDAHYYDNDHCASFIMVKAAACTEDEILKAVRNGDFYASQGPEIHLWREGNDFCVRSSPCTEIVFHSNFGWSPRVFEGDGLTEARYTLRVGEAFIRAEAVDQNGKHAWTNIIPV